MRLLLVEDEKKVSSFIKKGLEGKATPSIKRLLEEFEKLDVQMNQEKTRIHTFCHDIEDLPDVTGPGVALQPFQSDRYGVMSLRYTRLFPAQTIHFQTRWKEELRNSPSFRLKR
jgi:hypothetical protein